MYQLAPRINVQALEEGCRIVENLRDEEWDYSKMWDYKSDNKGCFCGWYKEKGKLPVGISFCEKFSISTHAFSFLFPPDKSFEHGDWSTGLEWLDKMFLPKTATRQQVVSHVRKFITYKERQRFAWERCWMIDNLPKRKRWIEREKERMCV